VGSSILHALLEDPDFNITILTRLISRSVFPETHPNVKVVRCEYTLSNLMSSFQSQDAVICAISIQSISTQKLIIEAAEKAGVKRFILDEYANSPTNQVGLPELERFRTPKREMVALAKSLATVNSNFTWSALATGNFIDYAMRKFPAFGFSIPERKARLIDDGTEPYTAVTVEDIGVAVRGILRRPEETANKYLHIRSTQTTQKEILDALEDVTGTDWEVEYADSRELFETGKAGFEKGERAGMLDLLVVQLFAKGAGRSVVVSKEDSDNDLLGVKEKPVKDIVKKVVADIAVSSPDT
jgi:nucleoside-diphosphate-sugar epimerase